MKKSMRIMLSVAFTAAIASCQREDKWISGASASGRTRDTVSHGHPYRYYGGFWYPVYNGLISPSTYSGASYNQIRSAGYHPVHNTSYSSGVRPSGAGSSVHSSFGS